MCALQHEKNKKTIQHMNKKQWSRGQSYNKMDKLISTKNHSAPLSNIQASRQAQAVHILTIQTNNQMHESRTVTDH